MRSVRIVGTLVVVWMVCSLLAAPSRGDDGASKNLREPVESKKAADGMPPGATTAPVRQEEESAPPAFLRRVDGTDATWPEDPGTAGTNVAGGACDIYVDADSYPDNTVKVTFVFLSNPGSQVCFSLNPSNPSCGQISPSCMYPRYVPPYPPDPQYWIVCPDYGPCENPCPNEAGQVTVTADPSSGLNQTKTVCLQERTDICRGQDNDMCVATYDQYGNPADACVCVDVIPPSCGSFTFPWAGLQCPDPPNPNCRMSKYDSGSGKYIFCSTYTAGDYEGRCRAKLRILNPGDCANEGIYWSYDQTRPPPCCARGYCCGNCEYISNVRVGSINKSSGCNGYPGGYADYTCSTDMCREEGYPITVAIGNYYTTDRLGLWVDWNQDEDFADTGETITTCGTCSGTGECTATITPPASALLGNTRMRVRIQDSYYDPCPAQPCGDTDYAEVEDYTVNIIGCNGCCEMTVATYPYCEGFESGFGDWVNVAGDDFDWTRLCSATPSSGTGPGSAHEGSCFLYTEASSHNNETAILQGPCFDLSTKGTPRLNFWYHMYGSQMGTLSVKVSDDFCVTWPEVWTRSGDQGSAWHQAQVDLSAYSGSIITIRFVGLTGNGYRSDMAIDYVCIKGCQCGDGVCDPACGEDCGNCLEDCNTCGDGCCAPGEDCSNCPSDCPPTCGDVVCECGENTCNCWQDCGRVCGDGCCNGGENTCSCPQDCGTACGDGCCDPTETCCNCPQDCGSCCGNGVCDCGEGCDTCPEDCRPRCVERSLKQNCAIDARQPSKPDCTEPCGWDSIELTFDDDASCLTKEDFEVRLVPDDGVPPTITEVGVSGSTATLVLDGLDGRIPPGRWTCFRYLHSQCPSDEVCLGRLPGDVNNDGTSAPADILWLIDCLNGVRSCESWQCDVDCSELCGPPDILRVIDLLNGAGCYDPWLNRSLPLCPTGP